MIFFPRVSNASADLVDLDAVVQGDVFLQNGIIKAVGDVPKVLLHNAGKNLESLNAYGAWVTPG